MSRKFFFSLFFASGVIGCSTAGFWQLRRKKWKEELIETRSKYLNLEPVKITLPLEQIDFNFRPVKLIGRFDHTKEMFLLRRYGERTGFRVITPFYLAKNQGFLVNRGWIPTEFKPLKSRNETFDEVEITGVMREGETASKYTPENSPNLGEWYFIELPLMSKHTGLENEEAKEYLVHEVNWKRDREVYEEEDYPEMPVKNVKSDLLYWYIMPVSHASYAAFWFMTAGICLFFNILILKKR